MGCWFNGNRLYEILFYNNPLKYRDIFFSFKDDRLPDEGYQTQLANNGNTVVQIQVS
jgi:hypothetical protein